jgi:hypothetical protein
MLAAVIFLGPPLSELIYPSRLSFHFLPGDPGNVRPERIEDARYVLALAAPILLVIATIVGARRHPRLPPGVTDASVAATQALSVGLVVICLVNQRKDIWATEYFGDVTLLVACALAVAVTLVARSAWATTHRFPRSLALRPAHIGLLVTALLISSIWTLPAINTEQSIAWAINPGEYAFQIDETFAVINGLTPLADFSAQYASLLPYIIALPMLAFGKTLLTFTITACALTVLALTAVYGVLRRVTGSAFAAFALFVPFMATSLFSVYENAGVRFTFGTYFPMFPLRYFGPYLLAWLLARHLAGEPRRPVWPLCFAAGFVLLNNFEWGVVALGATIAALLWTTHRLSARQLLRLACGVALGLAGALAAFSLFTLIRAGSLPDLGRAPEFSRLYGLAGYSVAPLRGVFGLHLIIYLTYVAAIGTATVRAIAHKPNRALTGMLAWAGVFGLGSATYYVARSNPELLPMTFSAWALALALLTVAVVQQIAAHPRRRPGLAALAVLFGMGIVACSVAQAPAPWTQIERVERPPAGRQPQPLPSPIVPSQDPRVRRFVSSLADGPRRFVVKRGAPIALFLTIGHRVADAYGVVDVLPYTGAESIHTVEQLEDSLDALREAGGNTVLVEPTRIPPMYEVLFRRGFAMLTRSGLRATWPGGSIAWPGIVVVGGLTKWVDTRNLHPAALS